MDLYIIVGMALALLFYTVTYPYPFKLKKKLARIETFPEVTFIRESEENGEIFTPEEKLKRYDIKEYVVTSRYVKEDMKYFIISPKGELSKDIPILFLLHGLKDRAEDWIGRARLLENYDLIREEIGDMIFVLPDSGFNGMGWYTNFYKESGAGYEEYFVKELVGGIRKDYPQSPLGIAGFSMGGYGAYKIGLKNLDKFQVVGSISGAISLIRMSINRRVMRVFKYLYVPKFLFNDVDKAHFIRIFSSWGYRILKEDPYSLLKEKIKAGKHTKFYLSVGSEDKKPYLMFQQWIDVVGRLKKYRYSFRAYIYEGETHTWEYVSKDIRNFLVYFKKSIKNN